MYDSSYIIEALLAMIETQTKEEARKLLTRAMGVMQVNTADQLIALINQSITDQFRNFIAYDDLAALAMRMDDNALRTELQKRIGANRSANSVESMLAACALSLIIQACAQYEQTFADATIGYVYEEAIIALN